MNNLKDFLPKLLYDTDGFCCLCLKIIEENQIDFDDEVILSENQVQKNMNISEILCYMFGEDVASYLSVFRNICTECVTSAVNSYKFMRDTKENMETLIYTVDYVKDSIEDIPENSEEVSSYSSLYLYLNEDLNTNDYFFPIQQPMPIKKETNRDGNKIIIKDPISQTNNPMRCKDCLKDFDSYAKLKCHFLRVHAPKIFTCSQCSKSYSTRSLLKAHINGNHTQNLMCSDCGKIFTSAHTLREHERSHYMRFVCQDCGRVYKNRNTYKKHFQNNICQSSVRHSQADAKFTCDYCQKKYTQKISLRVHIQYEHLNYKWHLCKWCPKKFWCQSRLKAHIVKHTKEKKFPCEICNGRFVTKESLRYHTRIHTGEKPYQCHLCDNRFLSASRRTMHIKNHHENPTVECDICQCKFKSIQYLLKHKKIHEESTSKHDVAAEFYVNEDDNLEQEIAVKSIETRANEADGQNSVVIGNANNLVYNVVTMKDNYLEIQLSESKEDKRNNVEYFLINKSEMKDDTDEVYLEVIEGENYVSENVEV